MNKYFKIAILSIAFTLGLTACVQDLDVKPIDELTVLEADRDPLFNKIYSTLALTGQKGADGNGDIEDFDEGASAFYRMIFHLNEFPADGGWWTYPNDDAVTGLPDFNWSSTSKTVQGVFYRFYFDIKLCNFFIDNYKDAKYDSDAEQKINDQQVAEVRWLRALNYYYILDLFLNPPFTIVNNTDLPRQIERAELYAWLETELKELVDLLPEQKANEYRIDKHAAEFLLMRMYLNSKIYLAQNDWTTYQLEQAAAYAQKVIDAYPLSTTSDPTRNIYKEMFMGDNNQAANPDATREFVLSIYQGLSTKCWGGSMFLVAATRDVGFAPYGSTEGWKCWRATLSLVNEWFTNEQAIGIRQTAKDLGYAYADQSVMPTLAKDDRCLLSQSSKDANGTEWISDISLSIARYPASNAAEATFKESWGICKWTGVYSDGTPQGADRQFPDTNIPFLRSSEAYMTLAEAQWRMNKKQEAMNAVNALRDRAHAAPWTVSDVTEENLLSEWQREFYSEGRRRTDLIRFDRFTTSKLFWEGKTSPVDPKYNVYPLPASDVAVNPNLTQYLGY